MNRTPKSRGAAGDRGARRPAAAKGEKPRKPAKLRVIGGEMRGRLIDYHGEIFTRPMKDNIRENLFNILGQSVRGAICMDLFAGTGALSFESLSRGARSAVMIERNRHAVTCIAKTAESLGVSGRVSVLTGDAFRLSSRLLCCPADDTPWIVFLCPPYALWDEALDGLRAMISQTLEHGPLGSVLAAEMPKTFDTDQLPSGNWDLRTYGGTRLGLIEVEPKCGLSL